MSYWKSWNRMRDIVRDEEERCYLDEGELSPLDSNQIRVFNLFDSSCKGLISNCLVIHRKFYGESLIRNEPDIEAPPLLLRDTSAYDYLMKCDVLTDDIIQYIHDLEIVSCYYFKVMCNFNLGNKKDLTRSKLKELLNDVIVKSPNICALLKHSCNNCVIGIDSIVKEYVRYLINEIHNTVETYVLYIL